jgi:hypothetical protein
MVGGERTVSEEEARKKPSPASRIASYGLLALFVWSEGFKLFGVVDAIGDLLLMRPEWKVYGMPPPPGDTSDARFRAKYQVGIRSVGGCVVGRGTRDYAASYNAVVGLVKRIPDSLRDEYRFLTATAWAMGLLGLWLGVVARRRRREHDAARSL